MLGRPAGRAGRRGGGGGEIATFCVRYSKAGKPVDLLLLYYYVYSLSRTDCTELIYIWAGWSDWRRNDDDKGGGGGGKLHLWSIQKLMPLSVRATVWAFVTKYKALWARDTELLLLHGFVMGLAADCMKRWHAAWWANALNAPRGRSDRCIQGIREAIFVFASCPKSERRTVFVTEFPLVLSSVFAEYTTLLLLLCVILFLGRTIWKEAEDEGDHLTFFNAFLWTNLARVLSRFPVAASRLILVTAAVALCTVSKKSWKK